MIFVLLCNVMRVITHYQVFVLSVGLDFYPFSYRNVHEAFPLLTLGG